MHLTDAFSLLDNVYPEDIQNIILDVLEMILKYLLVLPTHALSQIEPQLLLKVGATFCSSGGVSCPVSSVHLGPSPLLFHGNNLN